MKKDTSYIYGAIYLTLLCVAFFGAAIVFNFFPRSKVSLLEKRELAVFPKYSPDSLTSGKFTKAISS